MRVVGIGDRLPVARATLNGVAMEGQNRVDTVVASAGTGKTFRLVEEISREVEGDLAPHRLLATTFTKKAAAELAGRIRTRLISAGRPDLGAAMLQARSEEHTSELQSLKRISNAGFCLN